MKKIYKYALIAATTCGILGIATAIGLYMWVSQDLPSITKIHDYRPPQVTTVYARDNSIIGYLYREKRFLVNLDEVSPYLIKAILAAEDKDFYEHSGISIPGIIRALITNLRTGTHTRGGSTITQQVIKRLLLTPEKKYKRKFQEMILAYRLENYLEKNDILYIYINQIYMGTSAYGVEAAARTYFGKHASDLTLKEAAIIATLPQAPSKNNPITNPDIGNERPLGILKTMLDSGFITKEEYDVAVAEKPEIKTMPDPSWGMGAWYLEEVRRQLIEILSEENMHRLETEHNVTIPLDLYGEDAVYEAGLHVYTAMDPIHQDAAEKALRKGLHDGYNRSGWHGPEENRESAEAIADFMATNKFNPEDLDNTGWKQAIVTKVDKNGADVAFNTDYKGHIATKHMSWARKPNLRVTSAWAGPVKDATTVLQRGDIVWVSAVGTQGNKNPVSNPAQGEGKKGVPPYDPASVTPDTVIPLSLEQQPKLEGALVSIDTATGDLVALAGGYQYSFVNQFNRATQAERQPGSAFKPVVFSAALDQGFTAGTLLYDEPFELIDPWTKVRWAPKNFDHKFLGPIIFRTALAKSRNVCTVRLASYIGMPAVVQRARDLGITREILPVLANSLGACEVTPIEIAEAYTPFANKGVHIKPRIISSIENCWHEPLLNMQPDTRQAISEENAYIMSQILESVVTSGTGARARVLNRPVAGKTGTSNEERAAWFIGFSPNLVTSVYVGYDDNSPMGRQETGGRASLPIFVDYRKVVDQYTEPMAFDRPATINMVGVDPSTGIPGGSLVLPFVAGTEYSSGPAGFYNERTQEVEAGEDIMKQMIF